MLGYGGFRGKATMLLNIAKERRYIGAVCFCRQVSPFKYLMICLPLKGELKFAIKSFCEVLLHTVLPFLCFKYYMKYFDELG